MKVISIRENPELVESAIEYFQNNWATVRSMMVYDDSIRHSVTTDSPLPVWYLLMDEDEIVGCAGLITNDFISRMDLYPWICALYIENDYRGNKYAGLLLDKCIEDARAMGFKNVYLCTDHVGCMKSMALSISAEAITLGATIQGSTPWGYNYTLR